MADKELRKVRGVFVEGVTKAVIQQLVDDLQGCEILNDGEVESVHEECRMTTEKARCVIDMVVKKGRVPSEKFIGLLKERDANLYAKLDLDSKVPPKPMSVPPPPPVPVPIPEVRRDDDRPPSSVLLSSSVDFKREIMEKAKSIYPPMEKAGRKRLALLINNIEFDRADMLRRGADMDGECMEALLKNLDYNVVHLKNKSAEDMDMAVKAFAQREEHRLSDSTFVVFMSHGKRDGIFGIHHEGKDKPDVFNIDNIYNHLNTKSCTGLRNKPKIILIQACRGAEEGSTWVCDNVHEEPEALEDDSIKEDHKEKDFISLLSCTPDTKSYRHVKEGTVFIKYIVEIFNTYACEDHIEELFMKVMNRFENFPKQMPSKDRTSLTKHFYLFPGL
ncbi:caspase a-like [Brienomyrus brachyistius]|uniref:caspase a-like n=1 Tax=Brienomyrus brachyistius TaxID=42636 RepID=UPI0020B43638|nr:caspase a-like [Brienomyrus brachyistius]